MSGNDYPAENGIDDEENPLAKPKRGEKPKPNRQDQKLIACLVVNLWPCQELLTRDWIDFIHTTGKNLAKFREHFALTPSQRNYAKTIGYTFNLLDENGHAKP